MKKLKRGFTLVELLVVIGILAILTAVVLVAVNPGRQLAQARNTQRAADINAILTAITAYMADPVNNGLPPSAIIAANTDCLAVPPVYVHLGTGVGLIDLTATGPDGVSPTYIADIPTDPQGVTADTEYEVCTTGAAGANRITVRAPLTEVPPAAAMFSVTR